MCETCHDGWLTNVVSVNDTENQLDNFHVLSVPRCDIPTICMDSFMTADTDPDSALNDIWEIQEALRIMFGVYETDMITELYNLYDLD